MHQCPPGMNSKKVRQCLLNTYCSWAPTDYSHKAGLYTYGWGISIIWPQRLGCSVETVVNFMAVSCRHGILKGGQNEGHTGLLAVSNTTDALALDSLTLESPGTIHPGLRHLTNNILHKRESFFFTFSGLFTFLCYHITLSCH